MRASRRQALIRTLERIALVLLLVDLGIYGLAVRPLNRLVKAEHQRFTAARERVRQAQARVARLEQFRASVPDADNQMKAFLRAHVPPRRRAFSRAARLIRQLSQASGVRLADVAYKLDSERGEPLERLGIEVLIEGPFTSLLKFAHAWETASDFVVVRNFTLEPAEGRTVALRLAVDLYSLP